MVGVKFLARAVVDLNCFPNTNAAVANLSVLLCGLKCSTESNVSTGGDS